MEEKLTRRAPHGHDRHVRAKGDHVTKHHISNAARHLRREESGPKDLRETVPGGGSEEDE